MTKEEFYSWSKETKKTRLAEHRLKHAGDGECSGLTKKEYRWSKVSQKATFAKGKRFSHTTLWRDHKPNPIIIKYT